MIDAILVEKLNAELTESNVNELMQKYGLTIEEEFPSVNEMERCGVAENGDFLMYDENRLSGAFYLQKESDWIKEMQKYLEVMHLFRFEGRTLTVKEIKRCFEIMWEIQSEDLEEE